MMEWSLYTESRSSKSVSGARMEVANVELKILNILPGILTFLSSSKYKSISSVELNDVG